MPSEELYASWGRGSGIMKRRIERSMQSRKEWKMQTNLTRRLVGVNKTTCTD